MSKEKIEISKKYLIPKQIKINGINVLGNYIEKFIFPDDVI